LSGFWANRRAGVAAEAKAEEAELEAQALAEDQAAFEDMEEVEVLAALNLPDPDTLSMGDDFSVFMAKAVPDQIRRRALRTLWRSNSVLANVDMLVDYGEDFTDAAMAVENIQTAYQVGKGMLKHVEEMARQAAERENPDLKEEPEHEGIEQDVILSAETDGGVEDQGQTDSVQVTEQMVAFDDDETFATPSARRMKFRIEEPA